HLRQPAPRPQPRQGQCVGRDNEKVIGSNGTTSATQSAPTLLACYGGTNRVNAIFRDPSPSDTQPHLTLNRAMTCPKRALPAVRAATLAGSSFCSLFLNSRTARDLLPAAGPTSTSLMGTIWSALERPVPLLA